MLEGPAGRGAVAGQEAVGDALTVVGGQVPAEWATSSAGGPQDAWVQSTMPVRRAADHRVSSPECPAASAFGQRLGVPSRYEALLTDMLDEDNRAMFEWFATLPAYQADLAATCRLVPDAMTFARWLATVD